MYRDLDITLSLEKNATQIGRPGLEPAPGQSEGPAPALPRPGGEYRRQVRVPRECERDVRRALPPAPSITTKATLLYRITWAPASGTSAHSRSGQSAGISP